MSFSDVAWKAKYYGDVMLNLLYYLPTNILGWVLWEKNIDSETHAVYKKRMTIKQDVVLAIVSVVSVPYKCNHYVCYVVQRYKGSKQGKRYFTWGIWNA